MEVCWERRTVPHSFPSLSHPLPVQGTLSSSEEALLLERSSYLMIAMGLLAFIPLLLGVQAPYGKYADKASKLGMGWLQMNPKLAWLLQELPSFAIPAGFWATSSNPAVWTVSPQSILLACFLLHYLNRTFIYPLRIRGGKPTPFAVFAMAFFFCLWNG